MLIRFYIKLWIYQKIILLINKNNTKKYGVRKWCKMNFILTNLTSLGTIFIGILLIIFRNCKSVSIIGFKSSLITKNNDVLKAGNIIAGKSCVVLGIITLLLSLIIYNNFTYDWKTTSKIICIVNIFMLILAISYTNTKLMDIFDELGNRRS